MEWDKLFLKDNKPTLEDIEQFIHNPLWEKFSNYMVENFHVEPVLEYSKCSMQPGWNIKYKKKGKNLCTIYPEAGYFKALVVSSERNQVESDLLIQTCSHKVQKVYQNVKYLNGTKWLMMDVDAESILEDMERLIEIRNNTK
jgi:hypothetical protein